MHNWWMQRRNTLTAVTYTTCCLKKSVISANGFNSVSTVYVSEIQINNGSQIDKFSHGLDDKVNQRNWPYNRVSNNYEKPKLFLALSDSLFWVF
jgi:hypothetical protein